MVIFRHFCVEKILWGALFLEKDKLLQIIWVWGERGVRREREMLICCSTYLCIHWLILICALTGDQTHNLRILGWTQPTELPAKGLDLLLKRIRENNDIVLNNLKKTCNFRFTMAVNKRGGRGLLPGHLRKERTSEKFSWTRMAKGF